MRPQPKKMNGASRIMAKTLAAEVPRNVLVAGGLKLEPAPAPFAMALGAAYS